jgi:hypothetical protein
MEPQCAEFLHFPSIDHEFMRTTNARRRLIYILLTIVSGGLLSRSADSKQIITGTGGSSAPNVKIFDGATGVETSNFLPYGSGDTAGVRVAAGDVNGDGVVDVVTGLGAGLTPHVKAFSGVDQSELKSFFAQAANFTGGVYVAGGHVNGDALDDIVTGSGTSSGGLVKTFSGVDDSLLQSFFATAEPNVEVRVAAGDVNGDGVADIVTGLGPSANGGPLVKVFDGTNLTLLNSFFAYSASFTGGVYVAAGDVNGDGLADVITGAGEGGSTLVKVFSGAGGGLFANFVAFSGLSVEAGVGSGDVNDDGRDDIIVGTGPGVTGQVKGRDEPRPRAKFLSLRTIV